MIMRGPSAGEVGVVLLAAALAACQAPPPPPLSADSRVLVLPDAGVTVNRPATVSANGTGITHVSVEVQNRMPFDLAVNCTADWFDYNGHPVGGIMTMPARIAVPRGGAEFCDTVSPSASATSFRVTISRVF